MSAAASPGSPRAGACPRPAGLSTDERPVERRHAVGQAAQARPARGVRAADAVVADVHGHAPVAAPHRDLADVAWAYLATLASASETTKYAALSTGARERLGSSASTVTGTGRACHERLQRRLQAAVGEHGRMDAARELAQLGQARSAAPPARGRAARRARRRRPPGPAPCAAAARAPRAATARRRGGRARAGGARRRRPRRSARATPAARRAARAARRRAADTRLRSRPPRKAKGSSEAAMNAAHQRRRTGAGLGDGHEQEREQRAHVDGRELQPLECGRVAPAPARAAQHDDEQRAVEQRAEGHPERRQPRVRPDQEQVLRAAGAVELRRAGDEQRRARTRSGKIT